MILKLKEVSTALSQITAFTSMDKQVPGVLFDITDNGVDICYTNTTKSLVRHVSSEIEDTDVTGKILFDFRALSSIINACTPVGNIITDTIRFIFGENNIIKVVAEKKIRMVDNKKKPEQEEDVEEIEGADEAEEKKPEFVEKIASTVEQSIAYVLPEDKLNQGMSALVRERYELLKHFDESELDEKFPFIEGDIRPLSTTEWETTRDEWDVAVLRDHLNRLSVENSKVIYVSSKNKRSFVQNSSDSISMPFEGDIKYTLVIPTMLAKAVSDVLGKLDAKKVSIHMIDKSRIVFSTEDNSFGMMIKNQEHVKAQMRQFIIHCNKTYETVMMNFNKDVLLSCIKGIKEVSNNTSTKATFSVTRAESGDVTGVTMTMTAVNTNKSMENKYDINAEYFINAENIDGLEINLVIDLLLQAVNRVNTEYVAFDIDDTADIKSLRVAEINAVKRSEIKNKIMDTEEWNTSVDSSVRYKYLDCTTYFSC